MSTFSLAAELQAEQQDYVKNDSEVFSLEQYLELCKKEPLTYATAPTRMVAAIGKPKMIDTRKDERLSRLFSNRKIPAFPAFDDFYGMEDKLREVQGFFRYASQGLEESKQVLYFVGPVGSAKSSVAERLKELMEANPIYVLAAKRPVIDDETGQQAMKDGEPQFYLEYSPVNDSPLGLFNTDVATRRKWGPILEKEFGIPKNRLSTIPSPWAVERLEEFKGDKNQFVVVKRTPSVLKELGVSKTEPGDENNQNISALVGKVDLHKLEDFSQDHPDAYSFSGGLNKSNQGMFEFVEMFKAPPKVLHPLLTATQERNYKGTQGFGAMPFEGIILAHSNISEFDKFRNNPDNAAYMARIRVVAFPYTLRATEETKIYSKMIKASELRDAHIAPGTLEMAAQFAIMTRIAEPQDNGSIYSKMRVYDGMNLKNEDPKAKTLSDYQKAAVDKEEGMFGVHTRWNYQVLSDTFNFATREDPEAKPEANPVHLIYVLKEHIERDKEFTRETKEKYLGLVDNVITPKFAKAVGEAIKTAYLTSSHEWGQNIFDRYIDHADNWIRDEDWRNPDTGEIYDRKRLEETLEKFERESGIHNGRDFRQELVNFALRHRASNGNNNPSWMSHQGMRDAIQGRVFKNMEEILPVLSFDKKATAKEEEKHDEFVNNMVKAGYSPKQVETVVNFYVGYVKRHGPT